MTGLSTCRFHGVEFAVHSGADVAEGGDRDADERRVVAFHKDVVHDL
jgi:hypothetical protein